MAAKKIKSIFGRGTYLDENTSQAASVEFSPSRGKFRAQQTAKVCRKTPPGFFDSLEGIPGENRVCPLVRYSSQDQFCRFWIRGMEWPWG